jgi:hypothetical protein
MFVFFLTQEYIILEHIYNGRNFNKRSFAVNDVLHIPPLPPRDDAMAASRNRAAAGGLAILGQPQISSSSSPTPWTMQHKEATMHLQDSDDLLAQCALGDFSPLFLLKKGPLCGSKIRFGFFTK